MRTSRVQTQPNLQRITGVLLFCVFIALTAATCGSVSRPRTPQPAPEAQQILRDALITTAVNSAGVRDISAYDPVQATDAASMSLATLIYPTLVALDSQMTVRLWATENMQVGANGLTLTFQLRSGMKFSDGEPINAQAFAYSLNRALDPCVNAPLAWYLYPIAEASTFNQETCVSPQQDSISGPITTLIGQGQPLYPLDPLTLVITLQAPSAQLLTTLTQPIASAVPQTPIQQYGASQWTTHLTDHGGFGGSLFQLTRTPGQGGLRLTRNPAFWGAAPRLHQIDYSLFPTASAAYAAYQAGTLDVGYPPNDVVASAPKRTAFHSTPLLRVGYLGLNWRTTPFNDVRLRQAFAMAIDKQAIATQPLQGLVIPTNHIVPQGMTAYNPALVGPDSSQKLTADTTQSVKLVQAFASSACDSVVSRCPALTLEVPSEDANASVIAADIARMWQAVAPGYPLTVRVEPAALLAQRDKGGVAQLYLGEWVADYPAPADALERFTLATSDVAGSVSLPDAHLLLTNANAEQDPAQQAKDYQAAEQLLVSDVAIVPLYQKEFYWQTSAHVQNAVFDSQGRMSVYDTLPSVVIMRTP